MFDGARVLLHRMQLSCFKADRDECGFLYGIILEGGGFWEVGIVIILVAVTGNNLFALASVSCVFLRSTFLGTRAARG